MAFTEALRLLIEADTRGAVRNIEGLGKATEKSLAGSQKNIDKWGRGLTTVGATAIAAGSAVLFGLSKAVKAASDLGEAVNASQVVFGRASGTIDKFAQNSAKSMGLSERAFREALVPIGSMLQNFGFSQAEAADQSVKLAQRAADMASVFNTDVNEALIAIQAGLRGEADPLERFGVGLNEAAVNAKAMELGLADSATQVDASAKAQARLALIFEQTDKFAGDFANTSDSLANRQRILAAQFEDLKAAIGEGALPVFETFIDVASKGVGLFDDLNEASGGTLGSLAAYGAVGVIAAGGLSIVIGQVLLARQRFKDATAAVADFAGAGGLGRLARVTVVVGGLIALREILMALDDDVEGIDVSKLENQLLDLAEAGEFTGGKLQDIFEGFGKAVASGDPQKLEAWSNQIDKVDEALAQLASRDPQAAAAAFREISRSLQDQGASADQVKDKFDTYASAVASADTTARTGAAGVDELSGAMGEQADQTSEAQDALQEYLDTLSGLFDPLFGATDALMDNHQAQQSVTAAEIELAAAQQEHGAKSLEAMAAQEKLTEAQIAAGESAVDVKRKTAELSAAVAEGTVNVADAKAMLNTWVAQGLISKSTAAELAKQFDTTSAAARTLGGTDPNVLVTETGGSRVRGTLSDVQQAAINAGRERPNVRVSQTGAGPTSAALGRVKDAAFGIPTSRTININVAGATRAANALASLGRERQHGGPVRAGEAYIVGERRPELFIPDRDGMILPSVPTIRIPHGGGGMGAGSQTVVNYNMTFNGPTNSTQVIEAIKSYERTNGSGWRN